jgi:AcrR family transcriptional regulator
MAAARELFAERGVSGVTTQQIADRADVAIGTLYRYAATKAELLIMVQNEKFAAAIDDGLAAASAAAGRGALEAVVALVCPVVACVREQVETAACTCSSSSSATRLRPGSWPARPPRAWIRLPARRPPPARLAGLQRARHSGPPTVRAA